MTILSIGVIALATLMGRGARTARVAADLSYQTTVLAAEAARYDAIPFTSLVAGTVCDTVTTPPLPRIRCGTITTVSPKIRRVRVMVSPINDPFLRPTRSSSSAASRAMRLRRCLYRNRLTPLREDPMSALASA